MLKRIQVALLSMTFIFSGLTPAHSVFGGSDANGSPFVLTLLTNKGARSSFCSMAMLTERIVVTAAHCVIKDQGVAPELKWNLSDIYVSQPGADVTQDDIATRVHVAEVVTMDDFVNTWKPEINDRRTQINDIAFLFLDSPLVSNYSIQVATEAEVAAAISRQDLVIHFGYGLQTTTTQSHSPWTTRLPITYGYDAHLDSSKVLYTREGPSALCPGDSGGPWYLDINGEKKIVAVTVAASGCRGNPPYAAITLGTRIYPYIPMMQQRWKIFLENEKRIKEEAAAKSAAEEKLKSEARATGTFLEAGGCHTLGINAELQYKDFAGEWKVAAPTMGWQPSNTSCPKTHPTMPWTIVPFEEQTWVRWRFWAATFDVLGNEFYWINPVRPLPTPSAQAKKMTSFTMKCVKGKTVKSFQRSTRSCPAGWKIKK